MINLRYYNKQIINLKFYIEYKLKYFTSFVYIYICTYKHCHEKVVYFDDCETTKSNDLKLETFIDTFSSTFFPLFVPKNFF